MNQVSLGFADEEVFGGSGKSDAARAMYIYLYLYSMYVCAYVWHGFEAFQIWLYALRGIVGHPVELKELVFKRI